MSACRSLSIYHIFSLSPTMGSQDLYLQKGDRRRPLLSNRPDDHLTFPVAIFLPSRTREGENNEVFYYSTSAQLEELLDVLDPEDLELDLCRTIADFREEITKHMELTEKLTNSSKGNRKTYLDAENGAHAPPNLPFPL